MLWKMNKVIKDTPCQCWSVLSDVSQEAYMRGMIPELDVKTLLVKKKKKDSVGFGGYLNKEGVPGRKN